MDQKLMWEASLLERQVQETEQEKELIERELDELNAFSDNLESLSASKEKTLLSLLGKGVLVKTEIVDKKLFVNVGAGIMVRKTPEEIQKVISGQIERFNEVRMHLLSRIENLGTSLQNLLEDMQKDQTAKDCECEEECEEHEHNHKNCKCEHHEH